MKSVSRPSRQARGRRLAMTSVVLILSLGLMACGDDDQDEDSTEIAAPPDRESLEPILAADVQMPVWGYSAACDQPRPDAGETGLVTPDPLAGSENVDFYVPGVEQVLCQMSGVESASVAGQYSETDGGREGTADIGVVMTAESTEENMRAVRQAAVTAAIEQELSAQGIRVDSIELFLTDGSSVAGSANTTLPDGATTWAGEGVRVLAELRNADHGTHWSVEAGEEFVLSTYLSEDLDTLDTEELQEVVDLAFSDSTAVDVPVSAASREDRVVLTDGELTVTYVSGLTTELSADVREILLEIRDMGDVETVEVLLEADEGGQEVLEVRIHAASPATAPDVEDVLTELEDAAAAQGLEVNGEVLGAPVESDA